MTQEIPKPEAAGTTPEAKAEEAGSPRDTEEVDERGLAGKVSNYYKSGSIWRKAFIWGAAVAVLGSGLGVDYYINARKNQCNKYTTEYFYQDAE